MTALPPKADLLAIADQGDAKSLFSDLLDNLLALFGSDGTAATARATLGAEAAANKATGFGTVNNTLYPTVQAVKTYADALVVGLLDDRGSFDASGNVWPSSGGSGTAGAIMKGDLWYMSVAGTLGGTAVAVNDTIRALVDTPGSTAANWDVLLSPASVATQTHAATSKATPVDADELGLVDSAASNVLKRLTWANLKATLSATAETWTSDKTLGENMGIVLDAALSADGKYCGVVEAGTAGAALAFGELCYQQTSDGRWMKSQAAAAQIATAPLKLGICVLAAASNGSATTILLYGKVRADALYPTMTIGAPVYMSAATAGQVTSTAPTGTTDFTVRKIGFANTGDELFFNPSPDYITLA